MTPDELRRVRQIFEQALLMSNYTRPAFLDRECEGNPELRRDVEGLLNARERVPYWLDLPVVGAVTPDVPDMAGRSLGSYTLLREIGRGGMGIVYLAERSDGAFQKQVAVKLVLPRPGMSEIIARFRREREILARLDHPNIARLLDGGVTEEAWPYFVMEFVEGQPINVWCDEKKLTISERISLFRYILAAVQYAHQRLVVHRDLKPGNIFVTKDGVVKLLDFGIAKIVSTAEAAEAADTVTLAQIMTPEYASPEQVKGTAINTLSDVYSLGVILYELLTGHRPYRLFSAAMHEMARVIAEVEPTRPSEVVTMTESISGRSRDVITPVAVSAVREGDPERLRKRLSGDLDSILLMALHKEPDKRYSSAESFAADLERHLAHRPIAAREATAWYRFRRFCRRNPSGVAAAILLLVSFVGSGAAVVLQARHDIEIAVQNPEHRVFLAPVILFFATVSFVAFGGFLYFVKPARTVMIGAVVGGTVWGLAIAFKWWFEHHLGWWRSRVPGTMDPLLILTPMTLLLFALIGTLLLLILFAIGRRYGWRGQAIALIAFSLFQAPREHFWYGTIIPVLNFQPGAAPIVGSAAMLAAAGLMGLLVMNSFRGPGPVWYALKEEEHGL